jgi:hypothetical protein
MLELPGQLPIFIIGDAIDECFNTTGTSSPREKVLDFIEHLAPSNHFNLYFCATNRPEHGIQSILMFAIPIITTEQCGDGEERTRNLLSCALGKSRWNVRHLR